MQKNLNNQNKEYGRIVSFFSGVARIQGLTHTFLHEVLLDDENNQVAIVIGLDKDFVEALFFEDDIDLEKLLFRGHKMFSIPYSDGYLGRVVDGLGNPRDGLGKIQGKNNHVFHKAPQIIDREPVSIPLSTGIKMIDTVLPLGRGQRELIIGDRKLGKSSIALDIILNQKRAKPAVNCIYVICGQKKNQLKDVVSLFTENNAFIYTTIVSATAADSLAAQYLAPFVGCAMGEYFRNEGKDALVVYDDLSKHAKAYRDIMLLLKRAPGREAYPGDIFSLHASLLERAAKLSKKKGGGSLTALPIIETQEGDISSFIPTNLISITDGQIYLEQGLFQKSFLPAINVGLSVSRVGSKVQPLTLKEVVGGIRLALSQHKELQKLVQLETVVSEETQKKIHRGELILELLKQEKHKNVIWEEQVVLFYAVENGFFDNIEKDQWKDSEDLLLKLIRSRYKGMITKIKEGQFGKVVKTRIQDIVRDFKQEFLLK